MRETEQCEQKKEKKRKEKQKKKSFQHVVRYGEMLFVKFRFLPHCSPHYHPDGIYIGWFEMWDANGAIELTVVDVFI